MAGMEGLGRVFNIVPAASGKSLSMKGCSAVTYIVDASGACTLTVLGGTSYSSISTAWDPANGFGQAAHVYESTADDGTAAWTKVAASWANNVLTCAGTNNYLTAVTFFGSQAAASYEYIKATASAANSTVAIFYDLTVQRGPANLAIIGA